MYRFTTIADTRIVDHADHSREEFHGHLSDLSTAPDYVTGNATGICCHTCQLVILETF